jgi:hypothetical protein
MAIKHSLILVENLCLLAVIRQLPEAAAWNITCIYVQYHIGMFMGTCIQVLCRCELLLTWLVVHACCVCLFFCVSSFCMCSATCVCVYHLGSEFQDGGGRSREHSGSPTLQHSHSDMSPHHSLDSASMSPVFANYLQQQQVQIQRQKWRLRALRCLVFVTSDMTFEMH